MNMLITMPCNCLSTLKHLSEDTSSNVLIGKASNIIMTAHRTQTTHTEPFTFYELSRNTAENKEQYSAENSATFRQFCGDIHLLEDSRRGL